MALQLARIITIIIVILNANEDFFDKAMQHLTTGTIHVLFGNQNKLLNKGTRINLEEKIKY